MKSTDAGQIEEQTFERSLDAYRTRLGLLTLLAEGTTDRENAAKAVYLKGKMRLLELDYADHLSKELNIQEIVDDAEVIFNSALRISRDLTTRWLCYRNLATAVSWRDLNQSLKYFLEFREELTKRRPLTEEENNLIIQYKLNTCYSLQGVYRDLDKPQEALAILQEGINLSEVHLSTLYGALLVSIFLDSNPPIYGEMIELCLELAKESPEYKRRALETLEKTSSRAFVEFISKSWGFNQDTLSRLKDKEIELREFDSRLEYLGTSPEADPTERRRIELRMAQILQTYWQHADIRLRTKKPLLFDQIVERIPNDTFLIEYHRAAGKITAFVASSDGNLEVAPLKIPSFFDYLVDAANTAIGLRYDFEPILWADKMGFFSISGNMSSLSELYSLLVEPIADIIKAKKSLIIIPNEGLTRIPFQALFREVGGRRRHLIEDFAISYTPSMSMLDKPSEPRKPALETCFSAGVPKDKGGPERSVDEACMVAKSFNTKPFPATRGALTSNAPMKDVIHLSCHSVSDNRFAQYNGLMLEDGPLTNREIIETVQSLKCSLITLSACSTFEDYTSDQTGGLPGALIKVGARSVVSSFWRAPADATFMLMEEFYKNLKELNKPKALQKAQIKVREQYLSPHPFFWAPFFLVGAVD